LKNTIFALLVIGVIAFSGCTGNKTTSEVNGTTTTTQEPVYDISIYENQLLGEMLIDREGRTLYVYERDEAYKSNCYDLCETNWPPFFLDKNVAIPAELEGDIETIIRDNGKKQLTYKGMPLYIYINDLNPGDMKGQGINGAWMAAATNITRQSVQTVESTTTQKTTTTTGIVTTTTSLAQAMSGMIDVDIKSGAFTPAVIRITKGTTVDWVNKESIPHTVSSDFGEELDSDTLGRDQKYSHTFTQAGTYAYHCGFHPSMKGTITVV